MVSALYLSVRNSLVSFNRHIVSERLHLDLNTLCYVLEFMCYSLAVKHKLESNNGSLHNMVLPRQWLLKLPTGNSKGLEAWVIPENSIPELVHTAGVLLQDIFSSERTDYGE